MTYNLLVTEPLSNRATAEALAECFQLPLHDVDVADDDTDQNARNWNAPVLCGKENIRGDVRTSLDIYAQDSVQPQPSEPELAATLAQVLGVSVLYPAEEFPPSAHWLATADGTVTRARLLDPDDEEPGYRVDAVEAPVADLPHVQVTRLPEIVYEQRKPTPVRRLRHVSGRSGDGANRRIRLPVPDGREALGGMGTACADHGGRLGPCGLVSGGSLRAEPHGTGRVGGRAAAATAGCQSRLGA